jgi:protein O-mannosyl-transferase
MEPREGPIHGVVGAIILLALPVLLYWPALHGPFLFDDLPAVVENDSVHGFHDAGRMLRFWEPSSVSFRPLRYLSFAVDWSLGKGSPLPFHITNALLHGTAALLLWRLLLALVFPAALSFPAALLFLVHPVQTEAVAYISGRKDILCAVFYLLALLASVRGARAGSGLSRALLGAAFLAAGLAAFLAKEMALTLPVAALLLDLGREAVVPGTADRRRGLSFRARVWAAIRRRPVFYGLIGALGVLATVEKVIVASATKVEFTAKDMVLGAPLALRTIAWHARKAIWPWPHVADLRGLFPDNVNGSAGWSAFWNGGGVAVTVVGLLVIAALALAARRAVGERRRAAAGGLLFFALALVPVLNLVPLNEPVAEHFLYLPKAGMATATIALASPLMSSRRRRAMAALLIALALLAGMTARRAAAWSDDERLWQATVRANPGNDRARVELGLARLARGARHDAQREFQAAIALGRPPLTQAFANLAVLRRDDGDGEGALRVLEAGLRTWPDDALLLSLRGGARFSAGRVREAREDLERVAGMPGGALAAEPNWPRNLGLARLAMNDPEGAVAILAPAALANPRNASLRTNLGLALFEAGRLVEAERELRAAIALPDALPIAYRDLAVVLLRQGRRAEAAAMLDQARRSGDVIPPSLETAVRGGSPANADGTGSP